MSDALTVADISEEHLEQVIRVRSRSFGPIGADDREGWIKGAIEFIDAGRFLGVVDGDAVVAAARFWDFGQWWGGRQVRMAGVAGVVVSPEYRGRGVGSMLMRGVLQRAGEQGYSLSALYPATTVIYRQLGYEFGGGRYRFSFPAADLRALGGKGVPIRRATAEDAQLFLHMVAERHRASRANGPLVWPLKQVTDWLVEENNFAYVAADGFVVYNWSDSALCVEELIAGSEETGRALWATVGSGSSVARTVHAYVSPEDPIHLLASQEAEKEAEVQRWMVRLLDAPAAIEARGFAPDVAVEVELSVDDRELPANTGDWHLAVQDGAGRLKPGTGEGIRLGARGLAALYAGTPVATLRQAGLASGGSSAGDALLDTAFAGSTAYTLDYF